MDSTSTSATKRHHPPPPPIVAYDTSPTTNTTFVHAHPSNFRAVVQHLTGSSSHGGAPPLHERREKAALMSMKKLEMINLNLNLNHHYGPCHPNGTGLGLGLVSPVSTLDGLLSPNTPTDNNYLMSEEEERAVIAEKGFYLHPINTTKTVSPFSNYNADPPQLLPLFPLHSSSSQSHDHPDDHRC